MAYPGWSDSLVDSVLGVELRLPGLISCPDKKSAFHNALILIGINQIMTLNTVGPPIELFTFCMGHAGANRKSTELPWEMLNQQDFIRQYLQTPDRKWKIELNAHE